MLWLLLYSHNYADTGGYQAFREFNWKNKMTVMEEIMGKALTNSYHKRFEYLEGGEIVSLSEYAKRKKILNQLDQ